jgi:glucokinase
MQETRTDVNVDYNLAVLLAGDLGGTKTLLGLFLPAARRPEPVETRAFPTLEFGDLGDMVAEFLAGARAGSTRIEAACFGVAGPVVGTTARLTNVPWQADAVELTSRLSIARVSLLNDLVALARAVPVLVTSELHVLQRGRMVPEGNKALIAAGTGLGEACLLFVSGRLEPSPSEAAHADFAARTPVEIRILQELTRTLGRVDVERVVSGPGLVNIHRILHGGFCAAVGSASDPADAPARISQAALERQCDRCVETLETFVSAYGAEAGNLALRTMATGGIYVGGGIAPKILPALEAGGFLEAFRAKAPMDDLMRDVPVSVILNPAAGLLGAAVHAGTMARATGLVDPS